MRYRRSISIALVLLAGGCLGADGPLPGSDAGYTRVPDLAMPVCATDNDGVITRAELPFALGVTARYLENPAGTVAQVDPVGEDSPDGPAWDFTSTAGEAVDLPILPVAGTWFAGNFPGATYATFTDLGTRTLGVFKLSDGSLDILGYASETPNKTLLVYDKPIESLRFPVREGEGWVTTGRIVNGLFNGLPVASTDTYKVSVDARGVVVLPFLRVANTLRVRVELDQTFPGGNTTHTIQLLYFRECTGEVGRMVAPANVTDPNFTEAAVFRRLAL